jgi:hypothetical protein
LYKKHRKNYENSRLFPLWFTYSELNSFLWADAAETVELEMYTVERHGISRDKKSPDP